MKNLKIGKKLLVTFFVIIILFCGSVSTAVLGLRENQEKYSEFYNVGYQITNKVMNMRRGLQIIIKDLTFITIVSDLSKSSVYEEDLHKEVLLLEENLEWLEENFTGDAALVEKFRVDAEKAVAMQKTVMATARANKKRAQNMLLDEYQPLVDEAVNMLIDISNAAAKNAEVDYNETIKNLYT